MSRVPWRTQSLGRGIGHGDGRPLPWHGVGEPWRCREARDTRVDTRGVVRVGDVRVRRGRLAESGLSRAGLGRLDFERSSARAFSTMSRTSRISVGNVPGDTVLDRPLDAAAAPVRHVARGRQIDRRRSCSTGLPSTSITSTPYGFSTRRFSSGLPFTTSRSATYPTRTLPSRSPSPSAWAPFHVA